MYWYHGFEHCACQYIGWAETQLSHPPHHHYCVHFHHRHRYLLGPHGCPSAYHLPRTGSHHLDHHGVCRHGGWSCLFMLNMPRCSHAVAVHTCTWRCFMGQPSAFYSCGCTSWFIGRAVMPSNVYLQRRKSLNWHVTLPSHEHHDVPNHRHIDCFIQILVQAQKKSTSKICITETLW